jgi:hypothetical protein
MTCVRLVPAMNLWRCATALTCNGSALGLSCEFGGDAQLRETALVGMSRACPRALVWRDGHRYLAGSILGGAGFGAAFLGGLRALAAAIPQHQRAGVMSAFYVAAYTSLSLPAVLAGLVVAHAALPTTFELFGSVVGTIALIVAFEAWRTRPTPQLAA